jgi:hypothetical protein
MDKVHKHSASECYTPSLERFRMSCTTVRTFLSVMHHRQISSQCFAPSSEPLKSHSQRKSILCITVTILVLRLWQLELNISVKSQIYKVAGILYTTLLCQTYNFFSVSRIISGENVTRVLQGDLWLACHLRVQPVSLVYYYPTQTVTSLFSPSLEFITPRLRDPWGLQPS